MPLGCAVFEEAGCQGQVRVVMYLTTWDEWVAMGEQIKKARQLLLDKLHELLSGDHQAREQVEGLRKALNGLQVTQCKLDDLLCAAFPDKADEDITKVFYGDQSRTSDDAKTLD